MNFLLLVKTNIGNLPHSIHSNANTALAEGDILVNDGPDEILIGLGEDINEVVTEVYSYYIAKYVGGMFSELEGQA
jgi:hypothetical protein